MTSHWSPFRPADSTPRSTFNRSAMPRRPCPPPDGPFPVPVAGHLVMETGLVTASSNRWSPTVTRSVTRNLTNVPQHVRQRVLQNPVRLP
jgi:hypothetical protein